MALYIIGNRRFEASDLAAAIAFVQSQGWTGKLTRVQVTNDRVVNVTCGWGKTSHRWETTVAEASAHHNLCPDHRG